MAEHLPSIHPKLALLSAQRAANWLLAALLVIGGGLVLLFLALLAMFAQTLLPHFVEFCLMVWQALSVQATYRLMFLGLSVLVLSILAFWVRLVLNARATQYQVQMLLKQKVPSPAPLTRVLDNLGLLPHVDVIAITQPIGFCYGWRAPRILVTTGLVELLSAQELLSVLAHEKYHFAQCDPLKILFVRALRDALVFLPLVRDLVENYLVLQEIAADQTALAAGATRDALASALLKLLDAPAWREWSVSAYTPLSARVQHLANPQRPVAFRFSWRRLVVSALVLALMLLAIFHPMASMPLGEMLHADCHPTVVWDVESASILEA